MNKEVVLPLDNLRKISPDLQQVTVYTDYPGVDGWVVKITYTNGRYSMFSVDRGDSNDDMLRITRVAIIKQLEEHESGKAR